MTKPRLQVCSSGRILESVASNHILDTPSVFGFFPRVGRLFKVENFRDEALERECTALKHVRGHAEVSSVVPEGAVHVQLLFAHGHDGEVDDGLTETRLHEGSSRAKDVDGGVDGTLRARCFDDGVGAQSQIVFFDDAGRILFR